MFKVGEKYKIYRSGAIELKDKKWVKAVVEHALYDLFWRTY